MSAMGLGTRSAILAILGSALALSACGRNDDQAAKGADPAGPLAPSAPAPPRPQGQIATLGGEVVARSLAKNGLAEAQVVEASRANGVLTMRVRFQRAQGTRGTETIYGYSGPGDDVYVIAADKKYFLLADTEGARLASKELYLKLNENTPVAATWFGKFPAPGPEVRAVSLVLPNVEPLDNIPLTDR